MFLCKYIVIDNGLLLVNSIETQQDREMVSRIDELKQKGRPQMLVFILAAGKQTAGDM